jgi:hypothetical protein
MFDSAHLSSGIPFLLITASLISALLRKKIMNARGLSPMIVNRADYPAHYWIQVILRTLIMAVTGWVAFEVIFYSA